MMQLILQYYVLNLKNDFFFFSIWNCKKNQIIFIPERILN